ncbi:MAG TPA: hypothetical protein VK879_16620 [Candidatus Sulfomarinibacteraceae bacterium]|nr:hypothetical protein [Candidatus Sulfomarinibacteraceae bacterium]
MTLSAPPNDEPPRQASPAPPPDPVADRALLFGLLSGPIAWTIYFVAGYLVAEAGCYVPALRQPASGLGLSRLPLLSLIVIALALPALAVNLYGAGSTWRRWRQLGGGEAEAREVTRFLTLSGLVLNLIFLLAILLIVIPLFFITPCGWS